MEELIRFSVWAFVGGLVGTVAMDAIKYVGHKAKLIGGVKMDMLGRWSLGMLQGKFIHKDIHHSPGFPNEVAAGWIFHYLTGGLVALGYPLALLVLGIPMPQDHVVYALIFGLCTSVFPWFIVYPAFGVGWFGSRAPKAARPVVTSLVSHTFYGGGIGILLNAVL